MKYFGSTSAGLRQHPVHQDELFIHFGVEEEGKMKENCGVDYVYGEIRELLLSACVLKRKKNPQVSALVEVYGSILTCLRLQMTSRASVKGGHIQEDVYFCNIISNVGETCIK